MECWFAYNFTMVFSFFGNWVLMRHKKVMHALIMATLKRRFSHPITKLTVPREQKIYNISETFKKVLLDRLTIQMWVLAYFWFWHTHYRKRKNFRTPFNPKVWLSLLNVPFLGTTLTSSLYILRGVYFWVRKWVRRAGGRGETRVAAQQKKPGFMHFLTHKSTLRSIYLCKR